MAHRAGDGHRGCGRAAAVRNARSIRDSCHIGRMVSPPPDATAAAAAAAVVDAVVFAPSYQVSASAGGGAGAAASLCLGPAPAAARGAPKRRWGWQVARGWTAYFQLIVYSPRGVRIPTKLWNATGAALKTGPLPWRGPKTAPPATPSPPILPTRCMPPLQTVTPPPPLPPYTAIYQ